MILSNKQITNALIRLQIYTCYTGRLVCAFVVHKPEDRLSHVEAHLYYGLCFI